MKKKPEQQSFVVGVRMSRELKEKIEEIAAEEERSVSQQVIFFLRRQISQWEYDQHLKTLVPPPGPGPDDEIEDDYEPPPAKKR